MTLDTPEKGSKIATFLIAYNGNTINPPGIIASELIQELCPDPVSNTAAACLKNAQEPVEPLNSDGAVFSLQPGSSNMRSLPSPVIPNTIWNVVSANVSQTYDPRASSLLFGTNELIASACSGPDYCTNSSDQAAPTVEQILATGNNDAIVTVASQTAGCVAPCQIVTFRGLAHTKVPDLGIVGYIFNNRNVENYAGVNETVACWLSTAGSSTCGENVDVVRREDVAFSPLDATNKGQADAFQAAPPDSAELALPFQMQVNTTFNQLTELTLEQIDDHRHHTQEEQITVSKGDNGSLYASKIVPELMGKVVYRFRARFADRRLIVRDIPILVRKPSSPPLSFYAGGPFKTIVVSIEDGGGDLPYIAQPIATFASAPGVKFHLDGWVTYRLLQSEGLPVIRLSSDGKFDALRAGSAIVQVQFGAATYNVEIKVEPPLH